MGNGLVTSEGELHAVMKRLMKPAFNIRPITSKFCQIYMYVYNLVCNLAEWALTKSLIIVIPVSYTHLTLPTIYSV